MDGIIKFMLKKHLYGIFSWFFPDTLSSFIAGKILKLQTFHFRSKHLPASVCIAVHTIVSKDMGLISQDSLETSLVADVLSRSKDIRTKEPHGLNKAQFYCNTMSAVLLWDQQLLCQRTKSHQFPFSQNDGDLLGFETGLIEFTWSRFQGH